MHIIRYTFNFICNFILRVGVIHKVNKRKMKKTVLFLVFISENKFVLGTGSSHILRQTSIRVIENRACGADSENMLCAGKIIVKFKKLF